MAPPRTCARCSQPIAHSDKVVLDGGRPVHVVCERRRSQELRDSARALSKESRALRDHADVVASEAEAAIQMARSLVRSRIADGALPSLDPLKSHGVPGDGSPCVACGQRIPRHRLMMTLTFSATVVHLHAACYEAWTAERHQV